MTLPGPPSTPLTDFGSDLISCFSFPYFKWLNPYPEETTNPIDTNEIRSENDNPIEMGRANIKNDGIYELSEAMTESDDTNEQVRKSYMYSLQSFSKEYTPLNGSCLYYEIEMVDFNDDFELLFGYANKSTPKIHEAPILLNNKTHSTSINYR
ncbi:hypothetical protein K502DRAFT_368577 [Neoconidiobolus thromboides FSU 785]|nr:hypothetical protein K502DRAFT_368577 [Neoconidiobolus thromboides FSU 785]